MEVDDTSKVFRQYDIKETSLHLIISILNIHIYADDNYSGNKLIDGGAMQLLFKNLSIDHYPYHKFGSSVQHWNNFNPTFRQRDDWSRGLFNDFVDKLESILVGSRIDDLNRIKLKSNIKLLEACTVFTLKDFCLYKVTTNLSNKAAGASGMKSKRAATVSSATAPQSAEENPAKATPNDMIKNEGYFVEQQMFNKKPFISSNYTEFNLPTETLFAQCFFSEFYFPEDANYPLPSAQIFVQVAPMLVNIDFLTLLWINTLMFSLYREKQIVDELNLKNSRSAGREKTPVVAAPLLEQNSRFTLHCDTYLEVLLPKVSISVYPNDMKSFESAGFVNRPSGIEIGCSRVILSNQSLSKQTNSARLEALRATSQKCADMARDLVQRNGKIQKVVGNDDRAAKLAIDVNVLAPCFSDLIENENLHYIRYDFATRDERMRTNTKNEALNATSGLFLKSLNKNSLNKASTKDVWLVELDSAWVDFLGFVDDQNTTLIQNLSLKVWIVNVWDFYNSQNFLNSTSVDRVAEIQREQSEKKAKKACEKLANVIQIPSDDCELLKKTSRKVLLLKKRSNSLSVVSSMIKDCRKSEFLCKKIYSKLNVITELSQVKISLNHSKVLFLLRLVDIVDLFGQQLKQDTANTFKYKLRRDSTTTLDSVAKIPVSPSIKDKNNNTSERAPRKLTRINSTNLADWFINGIIEDKFDESLASLKRGEDGEAVAAGNEVFSVNLAVHINSIELDLSINDLVKEVPRNAAADIKERFASQNSSSVNEDIKASLESACKR